MLPVRTSERSPYWFSLPVILSWSAMYPKWIQSIEMWNVKAFLTAVFPCWRGGGCDSVGGLHSDKLTHGSQSGWQSHTRPPHTPQAWPVPQHTCFTVRERGVWCDTWWPCVAAAVSAAVLHCCYPVPASAIAPPHHQLLLLGTNIPHQTTAKCLSNVSTSSWNQLKSKALQNAWAGSVSQSISQSVSQSVSQWDVGEMLVARHAWPGRHSVHQHILPLSLLCKPPDRI